MGDRVFGGFQLVVGVAEAAADLDSEAVSPVRVAGGEAAPVQGADERGDPDSFGVGRGEQPGGAEGGLLGAVRDELGGSLAPVEAGVVGVVGVLVPAVAADEEAGEDGVVGGGRTKAVQRPQVRALRGDDLGQLSRVG
ncbi:hypothetical protein Ate01nite_31570 [Actinoplanes teichomyceticus]|nr:hypothetical protein Ate01nite_31570 [Actinoplanes teichomyceticus]